MRNDANAFRETLSEPQQTGLGWQSLPHAARIYVAIVIAAGVVVVAAMFPRALPQPGLFAFAVLAACVTAAWKVNLPIAIASGSTLSVSCAAKLMALLLLGPEQAVLVAVAGAFTQCSYRVRQRYPVYRTVFSMSGEAIAMGVTGIVYASLGGSTGPFDVMSLARPLVGAIATYFVVDTGIVAGAIALSTERRATDVWREDFLWSGVTFMVAGSAGAVAAVVIDRGEHWVAILLLAPVYLTYRTYELFAGRLEDQQRHMTEMRRMHQETIAALGQAHLAERALAEEKERLAGLLAEKTRLEELRNDLLAREQAARASAEEANRLKDQFLAIVSHELRTPLNAILGWADMLRGNKLLEPRRERAHQVIYESATRQAQLIDELLDVSRIMSGKLRLERTFVDPAEAITAACSVVQPAAEAKRVRLEIDVDPLIGPIYGDSARLQQITWNLLSNAIKFTPEGGTVQLHLHRADDSVELIVTDTGEGISRDFITSVFDPFRQADGSTTRRHGGLGLGLSIVKHLAEAHGGSVSAHSSGEGQGASFMVRLPVAPGSALQAQESMAAAAQTSVRRRPEAPVSLAGLRVLVVDDDEQGRHVIAAQLDDHGAYVLAAGSAAAALDLLQRERVDVLLADIAMPDEDGYTLIRRVRATYPSPMASIPAAALTAFARGEDKLLALKAGFQLHLSKPIDTPSLITAVARLGGKLPDRRQNRVLNFTSTAAVQ
jgi:signal transduction histidine kinase/ActR/RegA family two-component response regulator